MPQGCDDVGANALVCILQKTHDDLYRALFEQRDAQKMLLVPAAHSLVNVHISRQFIGKATVEHASQRAECHILQETEIPGHYLNLSGQAVEVAKGQVTTSFGFKSHVVANVIREDKIHDCKGAVRVCLIDDYLLHAPPSCRDIFQVGLNDVEAVVDSWCHENAEFNEALYSALDSFRRTFVMVPGYENETCSRLCTHVEKAIAVYLANKNDELKCSRNSMCELALNFAFKHLHEHIMQHLRDAYQKQEELIQNRILKLRKEMNINSTLTLFDTKRPLSNHNLRPSCEALKMMAEKKLPQDKLKHLAKAIQLNKPESRDDSVSFFILTLVAGGLNDAMANYAFIDMYAGAKFCTHKISTNHLDTFRGGLQFLLE